MIIFLQVVPGYCKTDMVSETLRKITLYVHEADLIFFPGMDNFRRKACTGISKLQYWSRKLNNSR